MAVVTNDIYTLEDAQFLTRHGALPAERIAGVETRRVPAHGDSRRHHDERTGGAGDGAEVSRAAAYARRKRRRQPLRDLFAGAGGCVHLRDRRGRGDKIPRKGGPAIRFSDLLIINKIDLAPLVGATSA